MQPELEDTATQAPSARQRHGNELGPGARLGHFRIERKLGAGGMGEVYLATDLALDRPVAIKVLASGIAGERLVREARAQARIQHPNVAHIYFIGEEAGRLYFAMEYIPGTTLAQRLETGPLAVDAALEVVHAAALGLREAQRSGFTHRDVKPSNLMIDEHELVKVVDFGLAAGAPGRDASASEPADALAAARGTAPTPQTSLAGTPLYMAPEQARGEPIDLRTDIYALGATLYHLVSGRPPFEADSIEGLNTLHADAPRPGLPRKGKPRTQVTAIDRLIAKMMAPRPADRFASYDELLRAIELASAQHTRPAGFWVRGIALGIDLLLVLIVIGLAKRPFWGDSPVYVGLGEFPLAALIAIVCQHRWGATAGMALFELEVVATETGARPSWGQAAARTLLLAAAPILTIAPEEIAGMYGYTLNWLGWVWVGSSVLLFLMMSHATLRVPGKRAPWDRISGTMVRYRTGRRARA